MSVDTDKVDNIAGDDPHLKKEFGTIGLLFTAIGSIIGSGWLFSSLHASSLAGPAAILSWVVGTIMFLFIGLSYAELGVMMPRSGGVARYPHYAWGSFASYSFGWITWLACASVAAVEVSAVLTYASSYIHWLENPNGTLKPAGLVVAILMLGLFVLINFLGVKWFARINNVLVWWKLIMIVLVIVAIMIAAFHSGNFSATVKDGSGFAPNGIKGAMEAIPAAGIAFSFLGWRQGIELAGETDNPKKNVPLTLIGSILICGVLYILLQVAFIGALDPSALAENGWSGVGNAIETGTSAGNFSPLAALATFLGMGWLAGLLYADAFISPGDTGLIYTSVTARMSYAMGRNRNAPAELAKVNNNGVPWVSLILAWIAGSIFFLPFPSWQQLVSIVTSLTVLSFGSGSIALLTFRKQLPDMERPYRSRMPWVIAPLALLATNLIMYWAGWDQVWKMMAAVAIGYIFLGIFQAMDKGRAPKLEFKYGWWVLVWFAGITLVSYLGSYSGSDTKEAGQADVYGFNGGIVANIVLTAVVLALAWYCQLPKERVEAILNETEEIIDEDEEKLAPGV
ncbi:amino acid permease [Flexivirga endophytica]|uniref:Amino acid permease n=1 Tax=Flexivirga endophytica TaxID=1849103 RepID=A0A916TD66_9MICO|nr:APC family permease [Flexivirga endophytica]GGB39571.1 amino acid permease [Flexivirga endophytica]GHB47491.1 amino acid permease [Flexivirga endophytica]